MGVQVVSSQCQSSGVKTDGAFLPRILSAFLLVSVVGDSAFLGQTSIRRGAGPVYSAPLRRALPRRGAVTAAALGSGIVLGAPAGPPNLFPLLGELLR